MPEIILQTNEHFVEFISKFSTEKMFIKSHKLTYVEEQNSPQVYRYKSAFNHHHQPQQRKIKRCISRKKSLHPSSSLVTGLSCFNVNARKRKNKKYKYRFQFNVKPRFPAIM